MWNFILSIALLAMVLTIPLWLILHYKSVNSNSKGLTEEERQQIEELLAVADKMADRIKTLEAILDAEYPDWREQHDKE